jgi:hypothetical protein
MLELKDYNVYEVQGDNALNFLQGQITNDIFKLKDEDVIPALLCNAQGRVLLMLRVLQKTGQIFLILRQDLSGIFETSLLKVAMLSKVKLLSRDDLKVYYDDKFIIAENNQNDDENLQQWHLDRIKKHEFDIYPSSSGLFLPQDLGLEKDWVSFSKGCYRGQEIIARMHYLGKSKYHLVYTESSNDLLKPGDKIDASTYVVDLIRVHDKVHLLLCVKK